MSQSGLVLKQTSITEILIFYSSESKSTSELALWDGVVLPLKLL